MMRFSWGHTPSKVRHYACSATLLCRAAAGDGFVYKIETCSPVSLVEKAESIGDSIRNKVTLILAKESVSDYFVNVYMPEGGDSTFKVESWFISQAPLSKAQIENIEAGFRKRFKDLAASAEPLDPARHSKESLMADSANFDCNTNTVLSSASLMRQALSFLHAEIGVERKVKIVEPRYDQLVEDIESAKPIDPTDLLRDSVKLFGQAMKIYTRQLTVKLLDQMTDRARFRRMS